MSVGSTRHPTPGDTGSVWISAASFAPFSAIPIAALLIVPAFLGISLIAAVSLVGLAALGAFGGYLGSVSFDRVPLRVTLGGALSMTETAVIGWIVGVSVSDEVCSVTYACCTSF